MDNKEISRVIHEELIPIQQSFKSYEQLASNGSYHFDPKIFRKCCLKIQEVIDILRNSIKEEK
jgi:hypothetical protein